MPKFTYTHRVDNSINSIELDNHSTSTLTDIFIHRKGLHIMDVANKRVLYKHLGLPIEDENWRGTDE